MHYRLRSSAPVRICTSRNKLPFVAELRYWFVSDFGVAYVHLPPSLFTDFNRIITNQYPAGCTSISVHSPGDLAGRLKTPDSGRSGLLGTGNSNYYFFIGWAQAGRLRLMGLMGHQRVCITSAGQLRN